VLISQYMEVLSAYKAALNCFIICVRLMPFGYIQSIRGTMPLFINTVRFTKMKKETLYGLS